MKRKRHQGNGELGAGQLWEAELQYKSWVFKHRSLSRRFICLALSSVKVKIRREISSVVEFVRATG